MKLKGKLLLHIINFIVVACIIECFLCSIYAVRKYANNDSYARIESSAKEMNDQLLHEIERTEELLFAFAGTMAANDVNTADVIEEYMQVFCSAQHFSAMCIHRYDGKPVSYGFDHHIEKTLSDFEAEVAKAPYVSKIFSNGDSLSDKYFYQAVPVGRNNTIEAVLYGYITLDNLPKIFINLPFDGQSSLALVNREDGNFIMNTKSDGALGNVYTMDDFESREGYDVQKMRDGIRVGNSGIHVYRNDSSKYWQYTYYTPTEVNNWSLLLTVDERTAFQSYDNIGFVIVIVAVFVIVLMFIHLVILMIQNAHTNFRDKQRLQRSNYMYEVQQSLFNAHNNTDYIEKALKTVGVEAGAETVMLLTFNDKIIENAYFWPSRDIESANEMMGRNIRTDFPEIYDIMLENKSVLYYADNQQTLYSQQTQDIFKLLNISSAMIVPIINNAGILNGVLCAVNMSNKMEDCQLLECVTYDFFMAITNIESHNIIRNMGMMDYLTGVKNRNSYESEHGQSQFIESDNVWAVFIDVNGLHEINNTYGHKAGDVMLCTVADVIKKVFGNKYCYRLGGDEFLVFAINTDEETLTKYKSLIESELALKGYYVSIGYFGCDKKDRNIFDIEHTVNQAETLMYIEKREYYKRNNISSERANPFEDEETSE